MAIAAYSSASPTIGTTEYSLAAASTTLPTKTDLGVYSVVLDTNALAVGDQFEVRLYEMGVAAGTKRVVESWLIKGPTGTPTSYLPATGGFILGNGWDITIQKIAGTDRAIPFTLWRVS